MLLFGCLFLSALLGHTLWSLRAQKTARWFRLLLVIQGLLLLMCALTLPNLTILQKMFARLLMPAGLFWLVALGGAATFWHTQRFKAFGAMMAYALVYMLVGCGWFSGMLFPWLQRDYAQIHPLKQEPFDAVLVLGGSTHINKQGWAYLTAAGDRVMLAARMYHQKRTKWLVTSGSNLPGTAMANKARETAMIWRSLNIPAAAIIEIPGPYNTKTEVQAYKRLLQKKKAWRRVGLITSAWHLRRTMKLCRRMGLSLHPLPADIRGGYSYQGALSLIPSGGGFADSHTALWELLGALVGR